MATAPSHHRSRWFDVLLPVTVFTSAWLLFQIQPVVAKRILPWFGGGASVWTAAMLFFQAALFIGYLYAHLIARRLPPRSQVAVHGILLAVAATMLALNPVTPSDAWKPENNNAPALRILAMLAVCVGPAYLMLAATAPLAQVWFGRVNAGRSPYRLYALSNVGSLAALVTYPFIVEPNIGVRQQGAVWSTLFAVFALACAASGALSLRSDRRSDDLDPDGNEGELPVATPESAAIPGDARPAWLQYFFWLMLPACASVSLLAITAYLCQDVASFPLMWILPLVTYLLTFILSFDSDRWYRREVWFPILGVTSYAAVYSWYQGSQLALHWQVAVHLALMLSLGMVCHGELAAMRPRASRLTAFYLTIAGGGAVGGVLAGIVAPLTLPDRYEFQASIVASWVLGILVMITDRNSRFYDGRSFARLLVIAGFLIGLVYAMAYHVSKELQSVVARTRNFYGVLEVHEYNRGLPEFLYQLNNGRISHGSQFHDPKNRRFATQYYGARTGVGQALLVRPEDKVYRVGVIGLGVGTLAAYAEKGNEFQFYEINPKVIDFAEEYFTYMQDARDRGAKVDVVEGDARLSLERQPPQHFDVLAVDAFSGDAIPVHLLTLEAVELYIRHLAEPQGILAVHISNLHLDLSVVVKAAAERFGLAATVVDSPAGDSPSSHRSVWVLLQRPGSLLTEKPFGVPLDVVTREKKPIIWTDDYSNLLGIIESQ